MKILLSSSGISPIPEIATLADELEKREVEVEFIPKINELSELNETYWERINGCDLLYYRTGLGEAMKAELGLRLAPHVQVINRSVFNNYLISNKLFQAIQAKKIGLRVPVTLPNKRSFSRTKNTVGLPFIFKAAHGIQGNDVFLVETKEDYLKAKDCTKGDTLAQELIPNDGDYRVLIFDGQVKQIFKRIPPEGSFRANISQGGSGIAVEDTELRERLSDMALKITKQLALDVSGVDVIKHAETGELFFIEANVNPGWKGLDEALGTNTAADMADWFISKINQTKQ